MRAWVAWWAVLGVCAVLAEAAVRLGARAVPGMGALGEPSAVVTIPFAVALAAGEGWVLARRFAPAVVDRAVALAATRAAPARYVALAPLHAVGLLDAPARRRARVALVFALIVAAAVLVRGLPAPSRAWVDAAVAVAMGCGAAALVGQIRARR